MTKILIIDDLATMRLKLKKMLGPLNVACVEAASAEEASGLIETDRFDLITLDLNLPRENGVQWLNRKQKKGLRTPVIVISDSSPDQAALVFGALENGAEDYIQKSTLNTDPDEFRELVRSLLPSTRNESPNVDENSDRDDLEPAENIVALPVRAGAGATSASPSLILIGASTGGPAAIWELLKDVPKPCPPICIVQHLPSSFVPNFAKRISELSGLEANLVEDGQEILPDAIHLCARDVQFELKSLNGKIVAHLRDVNKIENHRPSVEALFASAASLGCESAAILLTGMGADGAVAMKKLSDKGHCYTVAQSRESCVVYGMPRRAIELGAAQYVGDVPQIRRLLHVLTNNYAKKTSEAFNLSRKVPKKSYGT